MQEINGTCDRETIDQGLDGMEGKYWNEIIRTNNGIYEFDGGIDIHGADLSDEIDGTYENNRIVFFFHLCKRNNQWH